MKVLTGKNYIHDVEVSNMKIQLQSLKCPSCGAGIDIDIEGRNKIFCPYCGTQIAIDNGDVIININKRYTNDAAIEREHRLDRKNEREYKKARWEYLIWIILFLSSFGIIFLMAGLEELHDRRAIAAGMVQVGQSSEDMEGKKYNAIVEQLKAVGFCNIETVDLDDAGWFKNRADTVDSVVIDGKISFESSDFFDPNAKVVITYH